MLPINRNYLLIVRKCPEGQVGLPEESIEGYYDKDEYDPERKF